MLDFLIDCLIGEDSAFADTSVAVSADQFDGVEDGVFDGDDTELQELSEAGMLEDTEHISSDDIVRNISARNEFLANHNVTRLSRPVG